MNALKPINPITAPLSWNIKSDIFTFSMTYEENQSIEIQLVTDGPVDENDTDYGLTSRWLFFDFGEGNIYYSPVSDNTQNLNRLFNYNNNNSGVVKVISQY